MALLVDEQWCADKYPYYPGIPAVKCKAAGCDNIVGVYEPRQVGRWKVIDFLASPSWDETANYHCWAHTTRRDSGRRALPPRF